MSRRYLPVKSVSWEQLELQAEVLLDSGLFPEYTRGDPIDVIRFFECELPEVMEDMFGIKGFKTGVRNLDELLGRQGLEGYTNAKEKYSYLHENLYYEDGKSGIRRLRSTAGHEIYHCIGHVPVLQNFISVNGGDENPYHYYRDDKAIPPYQHPEIQAHIFCGCLLMPRAALRRIEREGKLSISYLVERFDVNTTFVKSRLRRKTING